MTVITSVEAGVVGENEQYGGDAGETLAEVTTTVNVHNKESHSHSATEDDVVLQLLLTASDSSSSNSNNNSLPGHHHHHHHPLLLLDLASLPSSFFQMTSLNLSNTGLSSLPDNFDIAFPQLSILFLSNNHFEQVPAVIGQCKKLQMVAFRSNKCCLTSIHPDALQSQLRWLILTDNQISELPTTIGRCTILQKLMLSGNRLTTLPNEIAKCQNLELIRLASNQINNNENDACILKLLQCLPKLSWVGLSDNPFLFSSSSNASVLPLQQQQPQPPVVLDDLDESMLENAQVLGRGAGGVTYQLEYQGQWVAVKQFSSDMTSDGLPSQERRISCQASKLAVEKHCSALIRVLGETTPSKCLVMEFLSNYHPLAGPPSLESCSRDVYDNDNTHSSSWTTPQALQVLASLLNALVELHKIGICHGDFYGHNILIHRRHDTDDNTIQARLTDFGAAFNYDPTSQYGKLLPRIELRAFSHLVQEVMDNLLVVSSSSHEVIDNKEILMDLVSQCRKPGATLDSVYVWLKQEQLKAMASAFDVHDDDGSDSGERGGRTSSLTEQ